MSFTHADVQHILKLLEASHFDELLLEMDGVKLELRRRGAVSGVGAESSATTQLTAAPAASPSAGSAAPGTGTPTPEAKHSGSPAGKSSGAAGGSGISSSHDAQAAASSAAPIARNGQSATSSGPAGQVVGNAQLLEIRAPMLGTFYRSPKPGADPFVAVGSHVEPDTVIGIIEVMKLMNSAAAGVSGEVVEILAQDGELVEYDQPLMRVRA